MLDIRDRRLLELLQEDASTPVTDLADLVGLSASACWRRIKSLEDAGLIAKRVALIDRRKTNVAMTIFVGVRTSRHSIEWLEDFRKAVSDIPEIVEAVEVYDIVYKQLITRLDFTDVTSFISMEELKFTTAIPMKYA